MNTSFNNSIYFDALEEAPRQVTNKRRPSGASFSDLDAFDIGALLEDDGVAMIDSFGLDDAMDIDMDLEPALVSSSGPQHTRRGKRDRSSSPPPPIREISINHSSSPHHERHTSTSDLSMTSSTSSSNYTEALQSLANSMKRTESTRKFMVQMKQQYLTPEQQEALSNAKEQLSKQNQLISQQGTTSSASSGGGGFMSALGASQKKLNQYLGNTVGQTL